MAAGQTAREKLVGFLDQEAFVPILRARPDDYAAADEAQREPSKTSPSGRTSAIETKARAPGESAIALATTSVHRRRSRSSASSKDAARPPGRGRTPLPRPGGKTLSAAPMRAPTRSTRRRLARAAAGFQVPTGSACVQAVPGERPALTLRPVDNSDVASTGCAAS